MNAKTKKKSFLGFLHDIFDIKRVAKRRDLKGENMENEKKVETLEETKATPQTVETKTEEVKTAPEVAKAGEQKGQPETAETAAAPETTESAEPKVVDAPEIGNGINVNDLVTKDDLAQMLAAFEAKFSAVISENEGLKQKVSDLQSQNEQIRTKYEDNGDFGGAQAQGVSADNRATYETFEEYSARFRR